MGTGFVNGESDHELISFLSNSLLHENVVDLLNDST